MKDQVEAGAQFVRALRPTGVWYVIVTSIVALTVWTMGLQRWDHWPTPLRCLLWFWLVVSVLAPLAIAFQRIGFAVTEMVRNFLARDKQDGVVVGDASDEAAS